MVNPYEVNGKGTTAFIMGQTSGEIYSISLLDPESPSLLSMIDIDREIRSSIVNGDYLYVCGNNGFSVIDISDSANISNVFNSVKYYSEDLCIDGNYLYVLSSKNVVIFNITDPANPVLAGSFSTLYNLYGITINDGYIYLAANGMVMIYSISGGTTAAYCSSVCSGVYHAIRTNGDYAYAVKLGDGLSIIDISDKLNPVEVSYTELSGYSYEILYRNDFVYVAAQNYLFALDVEDPLIPFIVGTYNSPNYTYDVFGLGSNILTAEYSSGMRVLTYSDDSYKPNDLKSSETLIQQTDNVNISYSSGVIIMSISSEERARISVNVFDCAGKNLGSVYSGCVSSGNNRIEAYFEKPGSGVFFIQAKLRGKSFTKKIAVI